MKYDENEMRATLEAVNTPENLRAYCESRLDRRGANNYVCPNCGSGTGKNKTAAFTIDRNKGRWKCFSCDEGGDLLDLIGIVEGAVEFADRLESATRFAGVAMPGGSTDQDAPKTAPKPKPAKDYSGGRLSHKRYIEESRARLQGAPEAMAYLHARGFNDGEIEAFGFGYDPEAGGAKDGRGEWCKRGRIVIPWKGCDYYHVDRSTDEGAKERKYTKPKADEVGAQPVAWKGALDGECCFVVEGLLDAYAVEAMGYNAVPLAGTGYEKTLQAVSTKGYEGVLVLMLDGDEAGKASQVKAAELCDVLKLAHIEADFSADTGAKDACEALAADRSKATQALNFIAAEAVNHARELGERRTREAMAALKMQDPAEIAADIFNCKGTEVPVSTGFSSLDNVTNGGLRSGLVVQGATSSAGKTTFVVQVADQIAAQGRPVLFVTIEQSGREIVAKSLSRMMAQRGYTGIGLWEMSDTRYRNRWPEQKTQVLFDAMSDYMEQVTPNLVVMAADEQPTVKQIEAAAYAIAVDRGVSPVVFVDYLQLLAPPTDHSTDKQAADYNVSQLRRMARDLKTPVWVISSLNRTSYSGVIEMESFKESGGIEYGADLLLGLQPYNMKEKMREGKGKGKDAQEARAKDLVTEYRAKVVRESEIVVLKNRNGYIPSRTLPFTYDAASSLFTEGV